MAQRRRRNRKRQQLQQLIGLLGLVLCVLLALALLLPREPQNTPQTDPTDPQPSQTESTPAPTTQEPTTVPTTQPTTQPTEPRNGWVEENGQRYYYQNGVTHTGWLEQEDGLYYFRPDGTMARGEVEIDGTSYHFTSAGRYIYVVNPWNYVPQDYEPTLIDLPSSVAVSDQRVDAACYDALIQMMNDCMASGYKVCVVSSYRTQAYQQKLFDRQVDKQMAALDCTREEAEKVAATISAIPGTSEHQLGLAVDIVDYSTGNWGLSESQEDLPGQQWLMENAWRYGFILRYPKGKTAETGIIYEPWHYRYVGTEVAQELHQSGQTLEAYLSALR